MYELIESETDELGRLIKDGYTSGILSDGEGGHISWDLIYNKWNDDNDEEYSNRNRIVCAKCKEIIKE